MRLFVNLPLSFAAREPRYINMFISQGVSPELGMDTFAIQELDEKWHKEVAGRFADAGIPCGIHLPFFDLAPGSLNNRILKATRRTLFDAVELASVYNPVHYVGHPIYDVGQHQLFHEEWLSRSILTWTLLLKETDYAVPLFLENIFETDPTPLIELMDELPEERAAFCFDVGHWYSFGRGIQRNNLVQWLDALAPRLGHLHLHDNDGSDDQHLALGDGTIPLLELFDYIQKHDLTPSATLEPHEEEAFPKSVEFLEAHSSSVCFLAQPDE